MSDYYRYTQRAVQLPPCTPPIPVPIPRTHTSLQPARDPLRPLPAQSANTVMYCRYSLSCLRNLDTEGARSHRGQEEGVGEQCCRAVVVGPVCGLLDVRLRGRDLGDGDAVGRAGHAVHARAVEEADGGGVATVLARHANVDAWLSFPCFLNRHLDHASNAVHVQAEERVRRDEVSVDVGLHEEIRVLAAKAKHVLRQRV
mmetsp:Transcript_29696/g.63904  ORF Transcript_29696/g.63904 Transcript_29696/m.63904 type:complete len:200 (+) Transcript_29696:165-764(+)